MQFLSDKYDVPRQGLFFMKPPSYVLGYRFASGFTLALRLRPWKFTKFWISPCKYDAPPPLKVA